MNAINLERALTKFWADTLGLTVDTNIFRGGIPSTQTEGAAVVLGAEFTSNNPAVKRYNVQILGKYVSRDAALQMLEDISAALPCYNKVVTLTEGNVTIRGMLMLESDGIRAQTDNGQEKNFFTFNLIACF